MPGIPSRWAALMVVLVTLGCVGEEPTTPSDETPVDFALVEVGGFHACGLDTAGRAFCWGGNGVGQLGNGLQRDRLTPGEVSQGSAVYDTLFAGGAHTCAIKPNGALECWGQNIRGQLGIGQLQGFLARPTQSAAGLSVTTGAAGEAHTCAVQVGGRAFCWGYAEFGQLGNGQSGSAEYRDLPDAVRGGLSFVHLTAGAIHTCGIASTGDAYCWGSNSRGQLGVGDGLNAVEPLLVLGGLTWAQLDGGGEHTCGVTTGQALYCWGNNEHGQLGLGDRDARAVPALVTGLGAVRYVSAGGSYTCAITAADRVFCWGLNNTGQLGDGTSVTRLAPTAVSSNLGFVTISAGLGLFDTATCGMARDGFVYCWGFGEGGQVGDGQGETRLTPVRIARQDG